MTPPPERRAYYPTHCIGEHGRGDSAAHFGHMFPPRRTPPLSNSLLLALASTMNGGFVDSSSKIDAGYTYLGQFIDHDLTLDRTRFRVPGLSDGWPLRNFRTPRFDLDCLYGRGPGSARDRDLYDPPNSATLRLDGHDLARRPVGHPEAGRAHIRDPRNDTNRIVSQLHVAFARFHNRVVAALGAQDSTDWSDFAAARDIVRKHYQWIVLYEFLPTLVGCDLVTNLIGSDDAKQLDPLKVYRPRLFPYMPVEFSAAAFRLGHSMVRSSYRINNNVGLIELFALGASRGDPLSGLDGMRPLPARFAIQWEFFFTPRNGTTIQTTQEIDPSISMWLFNMPAEVASQRPAEAEHDPSGLGRNLAYRNLVRGEHNLKLPSGQDVAGELLRLGLIDASDTFGSHRPMTIVPAGSIDRNNLGGSGISLDTLGDKVKDQTPLWYYILKEAQELRGGNMLGPVGARIVAEVVVGLLKADSRSILRDASEWRPRQGEYGCVVDGDYRMTDLLTWHGQTVART